MSCPSDRLTGDKKCGGLRLPLLVVDLVARRLVEHCPRVTVSSVAIVEIRDDDGISLPVIFLDSPSAGGRSCESDDSVASPTGSSSARGGKTENDDPPSPLLLKSRLLPANSMRPRANEAAGFGTKLPGNFLLRSIPVATCIVGVGAGRVAVEL